MRPTRQEMRFEVRRVLLQVIAQNPRAVVVTVRKTRFARPWMLARAHHPLTSRALPGMAAPM